MMNMDRIVKLDKKRAAIGVGPRNGMNRNRARARGREGVKIGSPKQGGS